MEIALCILIISFFIFITFETWCYYRYTSPTMKKQHKTNSTQPFMWKTTTIIPKSDKAKENVKKL